jgi:spore coat protein CotF
MNQQTATLGAHETMEMHEVLSETINCINTFQLFQNHVTDAGLKQILNRQLDFLANEYNNMVNTLHTQGRSQAVPYRAQKTAAPKYGLRQPAPAAPNVSVTQFDDRDVASCMLSSAKCSAAMRMHAALECSDPQLRSMLLQAAQNSAEMAYEIWSFMNQKGYYQVPTMMENTTQTMLNVYQPGNENAIMQGTTPQQMQQTWKTLQ